MSDNMLHKSIKSHLSKEPFLTQTDIAKKIKIDKVRISGFLETMVDYGDISIRQAETRKYII